MSYDPNTPEDPEAEVPDNDDEESVVQLRRSQIRAMEKDAKAKRQADTAREEAEAEATAAKRELAFFRAKVDTESPVGKLFVKTYDGELDVESITQAWNELNGAPTAPTSDEDKDAAKHREALQEGAQGDTGQAPRPDARTTAMASAEDVLAKGASREDAMGRYFGEIAGAAAEGDTSVIIED